MMSVPVSTGSTFSAGLPTPLINGFPVVNVDSGISYDISSDGNYFITTQPVTGISFKSISVVLHWTDEIKNLASVEK
jgi:hypothetical protein